MMKKIMVVGLMVGACGGDIGEGYERVVHPVEGGWLSPSPSRACARAFIFREITGREAFGCRKSLRDPISNWEVLDFKWRDTGKRLELTYTAHSCPNPKPSSVRLDFTLSGDGDVLALGDSLGVDVFSRSNSLGADGASPGSSTFGCYAKDGSFTPNGIEPISDR